jgi:hypothetical protein
MSAAGSRRLPEPEYGWPGRSTATGCQEATSPADRLRLLAFDCELRRLPKPQDHSTNAYGGGQPSPPRRLSSNRPETQLEPIYAHFPAAKDHHMKQS